MFFFYATGVTPAMTMKMVGEGSQYAGAFVDAKGNPLDGSKMYSMHMPPNIPGEEFLVVHAVRQPDTLDAPDRSAIAGGR